MHPESLQGVSNMKNAAIVIMHVILWLTAMIQTVHAAGNGGLTVETGAGYTTGKYGGAQSTTMLYVPFAVKYQVDAWTWKLTVPYLRITGPASAINLINGVNLTGAAATAPVTRSGLGDVVLGATRNVYNNRDAGVVMNLGAKVKYATASSSKGLGTGGNDYSGQVELFRVFDKATGFGTLGYKIYSSPAGYTLNNVFYGSAGASYKFSHAVSGGVLYNWSERATTTGSSRKESLLFLSRKLDDGWKVQGYVLKGFSNAVADWGAGMTLGYQL